MEKKSISRLLNGFVREADTLSRMDRRSIVVFLYLKGHSAKAKDVHTELVQVLGPDAIAYSTVTKYLRTDVILQNEREAED
jgi:hypothetical protein